MRCQLGLNSTTLNCVILIKGKNKIPSNNEAISRKIFLEEIFQHRTETYPSPVRKSLKFISPYLSETAPIPQTAVISIIDPNLKIIFIPESDLPKTTNVKLSLLQNALQKPHSFTRSGLDQMKNDNLIYFFTQSRLRQRKSEDLHKTPMLKEH